MKTLEELQAIIAKKINGYCEKNGSGSIYQPINYIMKIGGKRLRPALALMSSNLFTDELDEAIYPALAIEVFHNFTLMHDDIMDNAPLRRGVPTVHEKWSQDVAILSGDAMLIQSYQLLMKTKINLLPEVMNIFNKTALEVCEGQQLDMDYQFRNDVSVEEYIEMIRLKTSVLLAGAMKIGALIGGADITQQQVIYDFAIQIGLSFQLWDDFLDAFGEANLTGKQIGGDILADKKTFLLIRAYEKSDASQRALLNQYIGKSDIDPKEKLEAVLEMFRVLKVDEELKAKVNQYYTNALSALESLSLDSDRKKMLRDFSQSIQDRNS